MKVPCKACGKGCDKLGELMCTPFIPYIAVTFGLNTPAVVYSVKSFRYMQCSYELFRWLLINAGLSVVHMLAAFYIVKIIRSPKEGFPIVNTDAAAEPINLVSAETGTTASGVDKKEKNQEPTTVYQTATVAPATTTSAVGGNNNTNFYVPDGGDDGMPGGANSYKRIKHVLCYDKGMAVYIIIFLFWMVWMSVGFIRRIVYAVGDEDGGGEDCPLARYVLVVLSTGYVWMAMVGAAFCCSLLCLR